MIFSHKGRGKVALNSGRMTCYSFYVTAFPNGLLLGTPSYSIGGCSLDQDDMYTNLKHYHQRIII